MCDIQSVQAVARGILSRRQGRHGPFRLRARAAQAFDGAQERTRTFTAVKPLAPEASASTNSTTWACRLGHGGGYYGSVTPLSIHASSPVRDADCASQTGPIQA